jgi:Cu/Ag efflux protein CusF
MKSFTGIVAFLTLLGLAAMPALAAETKGPAPMKDTPGAKTDAPKAAAERAHKGQGTVNSVDTKAGTVKLAHGAIPSLNWPAMTMDFTVADKQALTKLKPGQKVEFKVVEKTKGQFVISEIAPSK